MVKKTWHGFGSGIYEEGPEEEPVKYPGLDPGQTSSGSTRARQDGLVTPDGARRELSTGSVIDDEWARKRGGHIDGLSLHVFKAAIKATRSNGILARAEFKRTGNHQKARHMLSDLVLLECVPVTGRNRG